MTQKEWKRKFEQTYKRDIRLAKDGFADLVVAYERSFRHVRPGGGVPARWRSPSRVIADYMESGFLYLFAVHYYLMDGDLDASAERMAASVAQGFLKLGRVSAREWKRFGQQPMRDFKYISLVVRSTFNRGAFKGKPRTLAFKGRLSAKKYRWEVVDRVLWTVNEFLESLACDVKFVEQQVKRVQK